MLKKVIFGILLGLTVLEGASAQGSRADSALTRQLLNEGREVCFDVLRGREENIRNERAIIVDSSDRRIVYERITIVPNAEPIRLREEFSCEIFREGDGVSFVVSEKTPFISEAHFNATIGNFCSRAVRQNEESTRNERTARVLETSERRVLSLRRGVAGGEHVTWYEEFSCHGTREGAFMVASVVLKSAPLPPRR